MQEDKAAPFAQAGRGNDAQVLKVALTPAAVTLCMFNDAFGAFLIGTLQVGIQSHLPARPRQKCRLDIVMAEDMATKRRRAGQDR